MTTFVATFIAEVVVCVPLAVGSALLGWHVTGWWGKRQRSWGA